MYMCKKHCLRVALGTRAVSIYISGNHLHFKLPTEKNKMYNKVV